MRKMICIALALVFATNAFALNTETKELLAAIAMPLAVDAVSRVTGVPQTELANLVSTLNQGNVAPTQFVDVMRYTPVALTDNNAQPFVAYRKLPGRALDAALRGTVDAPSLGAALGSFLAALHAFPVPRATRFTRADPESQGWLEQQEELRERSAREVYPLLEPDERTRADRVFEEYFSSVDDISLALVHGDLGPDHVLCSTHTVTGVIDWSDATIGDPAIDLAWPTHATPREFAEALLEAYGPDSAGPSERSPYYYRVAHLHEVLHALDHDDAALLEHGLRAFRERLP